MVKAVLLDVDGTLVDSNDAHARAWVDAFADFGHAVLFERVRPLIGKGGDKLMPEVSGLDSESEEGQRIDDRRSEIFLQRYLPKLEPCPQARELLERFRADGFRLVVATSAKKKEMDPLLELCGGSDIVTDRTSSDDAEQSKPDTDIVTAALDRAEVAANEALMLGDTPYDIQAATPVGVGTVALRSGGWDDLALGGAIAIYEDARDLLRHYEQSPFRRHG